jgi:hypothetical protein
MRRLHLIALAGIASFAAQPLGAATPAAEYDVQLLVRDGDAAPTRPRLLVRAGSPATFMIANERYSMRLVATPDAAGRVDLASQVSTWNPDGLHNDASTINIAADGAPSTLLMPHTDPGTGQARQLRVEVSIRPVTD